ncbi:Pestheic acid cluster transcriptional regulator [Lachnellula hyalina]|uniref:Pestheic acid cluster transcriptional regulator n=1 Tax=Lachnellula hyalina TaxID=1316788 RepID=A0A8H8QTR6_9HELO|nr:Pestheic acid cluster transcriptional regulator [Lachnellula hyalina]TVY22381.1 Pestheic acid cluster transcriptional regulator [Lachnellula hyalina]
MNRSFNGCWTCRLRRKKCDEQRPRCNECLTLHISTCNYGKKPAWMDDGVKQEAMAEQIKNEVKQQAPYRRRGKRESVATSNTNVSIPESGDQTEASSYMDESNTTPSDPPDAASPINTKNVCKEVRKMRPFAQSDSVLLVFYLERILPFLFPFYRPAPLHGGPAWILDLVISSPVIRQAILCQSSYFFALAHDTSTITDDRMWEALLEQTKDAFNMLRNSIQIIESYDENEHVLSSVRTMAAIIQLQRFEIAITCFDNCQAHLNAALTIFKKVVDVVGAVNLASSSTTFQTILRLLGPPTWILPAQQAEVSSSEQAAFRFSTALLLFDDIIASTALQERPQLYEYHHSLLCKNSGIDSVPPINLETTMGCQNWVLEQIGEIAVLDAWKKHCKAAGNLDVGELVHRATAIKKTLEAHLSCFESELVSVPQESSLLDDMFAAEDYSGQARTIARQSSLMTRIWAHSTFLYLSVIVSGWQPANAEVRHHVAQVLELLTHHVSPPSLLRTMAWPFCVVGCLTETAQKACIREMVDSLRPASRFSTVRRGFDIVERVWNDREMGNAGEFATYFQSDTMLALLV